MQAMLSAGEFLDKLQREKLLLVDVRSEKEFEQGHIPGAVNLPLLTNDHRRQVGITYKSNGRDAAVLKGFDLVGEKFGDFIREIKKQTASKQIMIYCWRGGMRSGIMSWVTGLAGYNTWVLKGGYKAYRQEVFRIISEPRNVVVVGGKTGSGKTEVLEAIRRKGHQVICLESLASHRGSAFGGLGMDPQPRNEMFQNLLAERWKNTRQDAVVFLENESFTIGPILLPPKIFEAIRTSPVIELNADKNFRIRKIIKEYGIYPVEDLVSNTLKLSRRLGGQRTQLAIDALENGNKEAWVSEVLHYYDKAYQFSNETRANEWIIVDVEDEDTVEIIADKVIKAAEELKSISGDKN